MSGSDDEDVEVSQARVGTLLCGKWTLDSLLGVGGMAAVYAATHKIGQHAAIKILHPHIAVSKEMRARFEQEALASSKLGHPGAVEVFDVDATEDGAPFMVMELLQGESLGQRAYRLGGIPEADLLRYSAAVLSVMIAAHDAGIVHRDIKPDNLFITKSGTVKVLDFGIARMRERGPGGVRTRTGAMLGTTPYMAPEQIHAKVVDGRADLFAIGATLFRILTKRRIHEAETDAQLVMMMGSTPAPPIRSITPDVSIGGALVIDRALAFDRDKRYPDARTMLADIEQVLLGEQPAFATRAALESSETTRPDRPVVGSVAPAAPTSQGVYPSSATHSAVMSGLRPPASNVNLAIVVTVGALTMIGGAVGAFYFFSDPRSSKTRTSNESSEEDDSDEEDDRPKRSAQPVTSMSGGPDKTQTPTAAPVPTQTLTSGASSPLTSKPVLRPTGSKPATSASAKPGLKFPRPGSSAK